MTESDKPTFDKGDRAAIVRGRKGVGVRGSVFWVGENKYGPGMRYGLRGDDGDTYWVDEAEIGREEDAPPAPEKPAKPEGGPSFDKGDRVKIVKGNEGVGEVGEVFWTGQSRYSNQSRYGVRVGEDTYWVDHDQVEGAGPKPADPGPGNAPGPQAGFDAPPFDESPFDDAPPAGMADAAPAGDLPPEAFEDDDMPPEAYEDDIPF